MRPVLGSVLLALARGAALSFEQDPELQAMEAKAAEDRAATPRDAPRTGDPGGQGVPPRNPEPDWLAPKGEFHFSDEEKESLFAVLSEFGLSLNRMNEPCFWPGVKCTFSSTCGPGAGAYKPPDTAQQAVEGSLSWDGGSKSSKAIYLDNSLPGSAHHAPYGCMKGYALDLKNRGFGHREDADVPKRLGELKHLLHLDLSGNKMKNFPVVACGAHNLESLVLDHNEFEGELWAEMVDLKKLRVLNLGHNKFSGSIPKEWADGFPLLTDLHLENNQLTGGMAPLAALPELRSVYLQHNQLTLPLVPWTGPKLEAFHAAYNYLSGSVPPFPPTVKYLWLQRNKFAGPLPDMSKNTNLRAFYASRNQLTGPVPAFAAPGLQEIRLEHNKLAGPIPASIGTLAELRTLDLEDNQLNGPVPEGLGNLAQLHLLYLGQNKLQGAVPPSLGKLTQIGKLALDHNELSGDVPPEVAALGGQQDRLELDGNPKLNWDATPTTTTTLFTGQYAQYFPDGAGPGEPSGRVPRAEEPFQGLEERFAKLPQPPHLTAHAALPTLKAFGLRVPSAGTPAPEKPLDFPQSLPLPHQAPPPMAQGHILPAVQGDSEKALKDEPTVDAQLPTAWFPLGAPEPEPFQPGRRSWARPADEPQPALRALQKGESACPRLKAALSYRFSAECTRDPGECTAVVQMGGRDCLTTCFDMDLDCAAMHLGSSCALDKASAVDCSRQGETVAVCSCKVPTAASALGKHLIAQGRWEATTGTKPPT